MEQQCSKKNEENVISNQVISNQNVEVSNNEEVDNINKDYVGLDDSTAKAEKGNKSNQQCFSKDENIENRFDDGKKSEVVQHVHKKDKMNIMHEIAERITEWKKLARLLVIPEDRIDNIDMNTNSIYEKCCQVLQNHILENSDFNPNDWNYWKKVLLKFDDGKDAVKDLEEARSEDNGKSNTSSKDIEDISKDIVNKTDEIMMTKISELITNWKPFGENLGLKYHEINTIELQHPGPEERCYQVMKKFIQCHLEDLSTEPDWCFWRKHLSQFEDGKKVIKTLETDFSDMCCPPQDSDDLICHEIIFHQTAIKCHHYDIDEEFEDLSIDDKKMIKINVGSNKIKSLNRVSFQQWLNKKAEYLSTYDMFKDMKILNCLQDDCTVVSMLHTFFDKNNGFAIKGCDHGKLFSYFGENDRYSISSINNKTMAYFTDDNIVLHIVIANKNNIREVMNENLRNIQLVRSTYECLQNVNISHIAVVLFDDTLSKQDVSCICKQCCEMQLIVPQKIFEQVETFETWYRNVISENKKLKEMKSELLAQSGNPSINIEKEFKQSIFALMAIEDGNLPTFTQRDDSRIKELKKLVYLSPEQLKILYSKEKHLIIKGGYGSGKSLVLQKKLEHILKTIDKTDVVYYICHDPQSQFLLQMKDFKKKLMSPKNVLVCNSRDISPELELSSLLDVIYKMWKGQRRCHIIIDEFSMGQVNLDILNQQLGYFEDSFIVIATQSMDCAPLWRNAFSNDFINTNNDKDISRELQSLFETHILKYSFRCSGKMNKMLTDVISHLDNKTADIDLIRHTEAYVNKLKQPITVTVHGPVWRYYYRYEQCESLGHSIEGVKPNIYALSEKLVSSVFPEKLYAVHLLMNHIFNIHEKFIMIALDQESYNIAYTILYYTHKLWTRSFEEFMSCKEKDYTILLTDHASIRGYEHENVIFMCSTKESLLKYHLIESLSRATLNLHFIIIPSEEEESTETLSFMNILMSLKEKEIICWKTVGKDASEGYVLDNKVLSENSSDKIHLLKSFRQVFMCYLWNEKPEELPSNTENNAELFCVGLFVICQNDNVELLDEYVQIQKISIPLKLLLHIFRSNAINVIKHLHKKYNIDNKDNDYDLQLNAACYVVCSFEIVKMLIEMGAKVNNVSNQGGNALHFAAKRNSELVISYLINQGADANLKDINNSIPLHIAAFENNKNVVEMLLETGSDVNATDKKMVTPISVAALQNKAEVVQTLLQYGANVKVANTQDVTPLHNACLGNTVHVVELLLENHADVNAKDMAYRSPLHIAAMKNNKYVVESLLAFKSDVKMKDMYGKTPLHLAAMSNKHDVVNLLLKDLHKTMLKKYVNMRDNSLKTALHYAASSNGVKVVESLLHASAKIDACDNLGNTPLHEACAKNTGAVVKLLIENRALLNEKNNEGLTAMHEAAKANKVDVVKTLIGGEARVDIKDELGMSPLHYAAANASMAVIKTLVEACADVNALNGIKRTPLHFAIERNSLEAIMFLIIAGADFRAVDSEGLSIMKASSIRSSSGNQI